MNLLFNLGILVSWLCFAAFTRDITLLLCTIACTLNGLLVKTKVEMTYNTNTDKE